MNRALLYGGAIAIAAYFMSRKKATTQHAENISELAQSGPSTEETDPVTNRAPVTTDEMNPSTLQGSASTFAMAAMGLG